MNLTNENISNITSLYQNEGYSIQDIANYLGVNRSQAEYILRKHNIKKIKNNLRELYPYDIVQQKYVIENKSIEEISNELNCPVSTLQYLIYNVYHIVKTEEGRKEFLKKQSQNKYGVDHANWSPLAREHREATNIKKYGASCVLKNTNIRQKAENTCLEKYGVSNYSSTHECKKKVVATNRQKYGVDYCLQNNKLKEKLKQTCQQRYGRPNYAQRNINKQALQIMSNKESMLKFLQQYNSLTISQLADVLNVNYLKMQRCIKEFNLGDYCSKYIATSHGEEELAEFIQQLDHDCILHDRLILGNNQELDVVSHKYHTCVEYNGTYWHSFEVLQDKGRNGKTYHLAKTLLAKQKGYRLIHIYEYEWNDPLKRQIIKSLLRIAFNQIQTKIYARECIIKKISNKEAKPFNEANHLQGHRNAQVTYGLFYNNNLVQLMSFSNTKYNRNLKQNNEWEIIRGCPGSNNIVVGGVSKLFKHFIQDYNPSKVFSYCDLNKFNGAGYEALDMKCIGNTGPDLKWILSNGQVVNRSPRQHKKLKSEAKGCIYGCGSSKYLWTKKEEKDNGNSKAN